MYDAEAPSFRHRIKYLLPELEAGGWSCNVDVIPKGRYVHRTLLRRSQLKGSDLLLLSKLKLSPAEGWLVRTWVRRIVLDLDDAVYLRRPRTIAEAPGRSWLRRFKFDHVCRISDLVIAGSAPLADAAREAARRVEVVPTPVSMPEGPAIGRAPDGRTLVWIGLPENLPYQLEVRPVLARLTSDYPDMRLRVISSEFPDWDDVPIERVMWSEDSEEQHVATSNVGIMPLVDDEWARGKCAFKLLQYMASGLPCVASAVGANRDVVSHGETGFLATDAAEWERGLRTILDSPRTATEWGRRGRERVRESYARNVVGPRVVGLLNALVQ